jgi:hypothetical protein
MASDQIQKVDDGVRNILVDNTLLGRNVLREKAQEGGEVGSRCGIALLALESVFDRIKDDGCLLHALQLW